jgi:hypothetical protein
MTLRRIGMLLFGENFNVTPLTNDPKDFEAVVTNSAFAAFDNADAKNNWLEDKLAVVATGGSIKRRKLYTTNILIDYPIHCFLGLTSRTPQYRRDDVSERLLMMKVGRLEKFIPEGKMLTEVISNRNNIMGEVLAHLKEIVQALGDYGGLDDSIEFRMADFAQFALTLAHYANIEKELRAIFKKLSAEQINYANEYDPIPDLLIKWASDSKNSGREVSTNVLCKEITLIADTEHIDFPYRADVQRFGMYLSSHLSYLKTMMNISRNEVSARKKLYSIKPWPEGEEH